MTEQTDTPDNTESNDVAGFGVEPQEVLHHWLGESAELPKFLEPPVTPDNTESVTPTGTPDAGTDDAGTDEPAGANAEAAKYRRRLREAEAERDALVTRLDAAHRREVERNIGDGAGDRLGDPSDLWRGGVELAELLDEDGGVDAAKLAEAHARVIAEHPTWKSYTFPDLGQGPRGLPPKGADLGDMLRRAAAW